MPVDLSIQGEQNHHVIVEKFSADNVSGFLYRSAINLGLKQGVFFSLLKLKV